MLYTEVDDSGLSRVCVCACACACVCEYLKIFKYLQIVKCTQVLHYGNGSGKHS